MPLDDQFELFVWVDEQDQILSTISRREAHGGGKKIHRAVAIVLFNLDKTKLLFQKRSETKDLNPGKWACGVGGHVTSGDTYLKSAKRELNEEFGLSGVNLKYLMKHLYDMPSEREIMQTYEANIPETLSFTLDPTEVAETRWIPLLKLSAFVKTHSVSTETIEMLTQMGYLPLF